MRLPGLLLLPIVCIVTSGCVETLQSQQPPQKFTMGFWFWPGSSSDVLLHNLTPDTIYVYAGEIAADKRMFGNLSARPPAARAYWAVFRFNSQRVPDTQVARELADEFARVSADARDRNLNVVGMQLDIDSPTNSLPKYAAFLHEVRKDLPAQAQLSITALLDWFRDGTSVADVIREVDEFVPQFYDVDYNSMNSGAIAAKFDAARWGPVFNRFGKRFRIGISTFGRARVVRASSSRGEFYGDLAVLDFASNPAFNVQTARNDAGETVLSYRASRKVRIGYSEIGPGDTVQFILPTPDGIRLAVDGARRMGGHCAGVVFFRWPADNESLTMQPDEAMAAAGSGAQKTPASVEQIDGGCAAVKCVDLYLIDGPVLSPKQLRYRIRASTELEYFLPEGGDKAPVRMPGPVELELSVPPWCGRNRMLLGRAVTAKAASFSVEAE